MSGNDRHSLLSLAWAVDWNNQKHIEITEIMFVSKAADDSFVMTTNNRQLPKLDHPVDLQVVRDNEVASILQQHNRHLGNRPGMVKTIGSSEELFNLALDSTAVLIEQMIQRRVLVEITPQEYEYLRKLNPGNDDSTDDAVPEPAELPEEVKRSSLVQLPRGETASPTTGGTTWPSWTTGRTG